MKMTTCIYHTLYSLLQVDNHVLQANQELPMGLPHYLFIERGRKL